MIELKIKTKDERGDKQIKESFEKAGGSQLKHGTLLDLSKTDGCSGEREDKEEVEIWSTKPATSIQHQVDHKKKRS